MTTLALAPGAALSAPADRLLAYFRAHPVRWIVLNQGGAGVAGLTDAELAQAVEELEAADLVERAAYGPLLYLR